jgi:hypothetical protein
MDVLLCADLRRIRDIFLSGVAIVDFFGFYLVLRLLIFLAIRLTYSLLLAGMMIVNQSAKLERIWPEPKLLSFLTTPLASEVWSEVYAGNRGDFAVLYRQLFFQFSDGYLRTDAKESRQN